MERYSRKDGECPQLLDLIPKGSNKWIEQGRQDRSYGGVFSPEEDQNKLELSLGLPGNWEIKDTDISGEKRSNESLLSLGCFSSPNNTTSLHKNQFLKSPPWLDPVMKECSQSQPCNNSSTAQKRSASGPVVGWPPVRTLRKNITNGSCSKASPTNDSCPKPGESSSSCPRSLFVKVNMDGIPIGRKVDLRAHNSYERLSHAVDELFRDLLPAGQRERGGGPCVGGEKDKDGKGIGGGEYTLVYEDNEGDRMLLGDVPWHMFVLTVKRLRVLKSSELPKISGGRNKG